MKKKDKYLIIGAAGFIGSNFSKFLLNKKVNCMLIDNLSYGSSKSFFLNHKKNFIKMDARDEIKVSKIIKSFKPNYIINFAAQSHVDRSISNPDEFIFNNLQISNNILKSIKNDFYLKKFINISTDEVYGSIKKGKADESSNYKPNSPYSQSKSSVDLLCRAYYKTYGVPSITLRLSNNYGPRQSVEKLIPKTIMQVLQNKKIPVYGSGLNIREWMYIDDTSKIIYSLLKKKLPKFYILNVSSGISQNNIYTIKKIIKQICIISNKSKKEIDNLINYVEDRPGHDSRYAMANKKFKDIFPRFKFTNFNTGIEKTIEWYITNNSFINESKKNLK